MSATSPPPASRREVPAAARIVGCCGIAAFFTANLGWLLGGLAQPEAYSSTRDDISDLGALTADEPWLYNQIGANLSGLLMLAFAGALWWALSPDALGRVGASAVAVANLVFSLWGGGAATRAATFVLTGRLAFVSLWFLRTGRTDAWPARAS
jgi:hypothetical membrane protein